MGGMGGMGGMVSPGGGMHGAPAASRSRGPMIIREAVGNGRRMTVEVPSYVLGDSLSYAVTLRDAREASLETRIGRPARSAGRLRVPHPFA